MDIITCLKQKQNFISLTAADPEKISEAEQALGLTFSEEYRKYISAFGAASYYGHELTGVCSSPIYNVKEVTEEEREFAGNVPNTWYVIERTGIDGNVIWQDGQTGYIYQTAPKVHPIKIHSSFQEYINA